MCQMLNYLCTFGGSMKFPVTIGHVETPSNVLHVVKNVNVNVYSMYIAISIIKNVPCTHAWELPHAHCTHADG